MRCCDCKLRNECEHKSPDNVAFASCRYLNNWLYIEGEYNCRTNGYIEFAANDIGKTAFLTKEEAEKALEELK